MLVRIYGAAPERSSKKLRSLAVLPVVSMSLSIDLVEAFGVKLSKSELEQQIALVRKALESSRTDAELYLQLGGYLEDAEKSDEARAAFEKAGELIRPRAEARPKDGLIQSQFAKALAGAGKDIEAEATIRRAIDKAPDDWRCWATLGRFLDGRSWNLLFGSTNDIPFDQQIDGLKWSLPARELSAERLDDIRKYRAEAEKCFSRTALLATNSFEASLDRARHRFQTWIARRFEAQMTVKNTADKIGFVEIFSDPELCVAWAEAARLTSTNYGVVGNWAWMEAVPGMAKANGSNALDQLSESHRKNVLEALTILEKLSEHPNPRIAAGAFEMIGVLRWMVTSEHASARTAFRRAVAFDRSRTQAWDGLVAVAVQDGNFEELGRICEERLKCEDSPRNRVIYAKTLDHGELAQKAQEQARKAVALAPNDLLARICAGALLLKHSATSDDDKEMRGHFAKAWELLEPIVQAGNDEPLAVPYFLNTAIVLALDGRTDEAREVLQKLGKKEIEDEKYKERLREIEMAIGN